jgi:uncharacterized protein (DUF4213/DUF364 family)
MRRISKADNENPWELYDRLIEGIPTGIGVKNWSLGKRWSFVESEAGTGIAMTVSGGRSFGKSGGLLGSDTVSTCALELQELAAVARSWCFEEASVGIAALNAFYNTPANNPKLREYLAASSSLASSRQSDIISAEIRAFAGRKVTVIGHFPHLGEFADICDLTILERNPSESDLPDPACEYVLPKQDLVIITGTATTNKTLVRLLALSENARTVIAGPSSVCSTILFDYGVDMIGGAVVADTDEARLRVSHGTHLPFGDGLDMVKFAKFPTDK